MKTHDVEFIVEHLVSGESGRFTAIGRCGSAPIRVGERFDVVYRNRSRRTVDELACAAVREVEKPASLRVVCIHAYDRSLGVLGQGMTGSLVLEGEGTQYVAPGWILGRTLSDVGATEPVLAAVDH